MGKVGKGKQSFMNSSKTTEQRNYKAKMVVNSLSLFSELKMLEYKEEKKENLRKS